MNDYSIVQKHVVRLVQQTSQVNSEHLVKHWELISALSSMLAHFVAVEPRKPMMKITPKETDEDVRLP